MSNNEELSFAQALKAMAASDVIRDERVKTQFISVYNSIWREGGETAYEREALYFNKLLRDSPELRKCTGASVFYSFIDLAVRGLSLTPGTNALCYLLPRSTKTGVDSVGRGIYEKCCTLTISGYGELVLRTKAGQIKYADNPVLVYEGDTFQYGEKDGRKIVNYLSSVPRRSNRIIACFMKITRVDDTVDYYIMTENDWKRLEIYSAKANRRYDQSANGWVEKENDLYKSNNGQIDPGFLMAKCVKHAFRSYPKIKIGKGTAFESDLDQEAEDDDYYFGSSPAAPAETDNQPDFASPVQQAQAGGVTIEETDDDIF